MATVNAKTAFLEIDRSTFQEVKAAAAETVAASVAATTADAFKRARRTTHIIFCSRPSRYSVTFSDKRLKGSIKSGPIERIKSKLKE